MKYWKNISPRRTSRRVDSLSEIQLKVKTTKPILVSLLYSKFPTELLEAVSGLVVEFLRLIILRDFYLLGMLLDLGRSSGVHGHHNNHGPIQVIHPKSRPWSHYRTDLVRALAMLSVKTLSVMIRPRHGGLEILLCLPHTHP